MFTRKQYLNHECSHREYYSQFVNDSIKNDVIQKFGIERLKNSTDEHFNDLPLSQWDQLSGYSVGSPNIYHIPVKLLRELGDSLSYAGITCIHKEAAQQIKESKIKEVKE